MKLTEEQRIAEYRQGWNDAQRNRPAQLGHSIMYQIGFMEAKRGSVERFATEIETETYH